MTLEPFLFAIALLIVGAEGKKGCKIKPLYIKFHKCCEGAEEVMEKMTIHMNNKFKE